MSRESDPQSGSRPSTRTQFKDLEKGDYDPGRAAPREWREGGEEGEGGERVADAAAAGYVITRRASRARGAYPRNKMIIKRASRPTDASAFRRFWLSRGTDKAAS